MSGNSESVLKEKMKPIMEQMIYDLLQEKPEEPALFMIDFLQKTGGYTANGITLDEKRELESLRLEIKKYRELEENKEKDVNDVKSEASFSDDDDEEIDDKIEQKVISAKARLSRQREAVSAEVYGQFNKKEDFKPRFVKKNDDQMQRIKARILQSFLFSSLEQNDIKIVIDSMEEKIYKPNEVVITQGESGDCLYIVETGELNCYKRFTKDGEEKLVKDYGSGDAFGELALLYNAPRAATVKARTECVLWAVDRETFNHIVKEAAQKKRERYENFLKSVPILSSVDSYELSQIADALKTCNYNNTDYVIREGELGDVFYIVVEGSAIASKTLEPGKPPVQVKEYVKGSYFGELALIEGEPRAANIVATSNLRLISLDRLSFKRLLGPIQDILLRNKEEYEKYIKK